MKTAKGYASYLVRLRVERRHRKNELKASARTRKRLSPKQRQQVLEKTGRRCHVCGGRLDTNWQADHVLPHSAGGQGVVENYLPAHRTCNNYRWHYGPKEFRQILKLGVWIRHQIELDTRVGREAAERFVAHEHRRQRRRKHSGE